MPQPEFWSYEIPVGTPTQSGLVLARPDLPNLFILNHSAAFLWAALQTGRSASSLAQPFATHFGIPLTQATADIAATLQSWSQTLLRPVTPQTASTHVEPPPRNLFAQAAFHFSLGASSFRLFSHDPDFVAEIRPRLAHLVVPPPPPSSPPGHSFYVTRSQNDNALGVFSDATCLGSVPDAAAARILLLPEIARLAHQPSPEWFAILHAAALAHPTTGHAILLPAATNSGKSTLAAALLHSGLHLLSDDSAAITADHQVLPLPFALMLRAGSWPILASDFPELATLPIHARYGEPVRFLPPSISPTLATPKHLVFVNYQPGAETKLESLDPLQTFLELQKSGFWVPHTQPTLAAFVAWVPSLPAYRLTYSNLTESVSVLHNLLGFSR